MAQRDGGHRLADSAILFAHCPYGHAQMHAPNHMYPRRNHMYPRRAAACP